MRPGRSLSPLQLSNQQRKSHEQGRREGQQLVPGSVPGNGYHSPDGRGHGSRSPLRMPEQSEVGIKETSFTLPRKGQTPKPKVTNSVQNL